MKNNSALFSFSNLYPIVFLALLFNLYQCKTKDTCNSVLGTTFKTVSADSIQILSNEEISATFNWECLEVLPDSYFNNASLLRANVDPFRNPWINDHDQLLSFEGNTDQFLLTLSASAIPALGENKNLSLHFRFPDRMEHIDCEHPGSGDAYFFDLDFSIDNSASNDLTLSLINWTETFAAGGN